MFYIDMFKHISIDHDWRIEQISYSESVDQFNLNLDDVNTEQICSEVGRHAPVEQIFRLLVESAVR